MWSSAFPFTRAIGDQVSPYALGFIRCIFAAVVFLVIGLATHMQKPKRWQDLGLFFLLGMCGFSVFYIFMNLGLTTLTSATASVISATSPIYVAIAAFIIWKERINLIGWISIFCAFAGVVILLMWNGVLSINIGILWMFLQALVFAVYNLLSRKIAELGYTPMETITYATIFAAIQMMPFMPQAIFQVVAADTTAKLSVLVIGIFPSVIAYILWNKALADAPRISTVTNYLFLNPLLSAILGFIMLREVPDMGTFVGGAIILASIILFGTKGNPDN